jgi:2-dehydropantoate 2-reductase
MQRFAVLGPGGVGGFVAAALAHAGADVTVVAREATVEVLARDGISVQSAVLGDFSVRPRAVSRLEEKVDALFVATKALGLSAALDRISVVPELVVPMLNGLDHLNLLREHFGTGRVPAATIRIDSDRPAPGRIVQRSPATRIDLAAEDLSLAARLPELVSALEGAGVPARVLEGERTLMWSKLVRLCALSATTSVADAPIGWIRSDPEWRSTLVACVEEVAAVAIADGAIVDPAVTLAELDSAHEGLGSSMQRDLVAGREPELDAIQGSVLRAAARHGLSCPTIAGLSQQIAVRAGIAPPLL